MRQNVQTQVCRYVHKEGLVTSEGKSGGEKDVQEEGEEDQERERGKDQGRGRGEDVRKGRGGCKGERHIQGRRGVTGGRRGGRGGRRSKSEGWSYLAPWASMKESKFFTAGSLNLRNLMTGGPSCKVSCSSSLLNNGKEPLLQEQEIRERGRRVW